VILLAAPTVRTTISSANAVWTRLGDPRAASQSDLLLYSMNQTHLFEVTLAVILAANLPGSVEIGYVATGILGHALPSATLRM
jgi:hypothetical protein